MENVYDHEGGKERAKQCYGKEKVIQKSDVIVCLKAKHKKWMK